MERRQNDEIMLIKLDQLKASQEAMSHKLNQHIEKTDKVINGNNGTPGVKTSIEVIKTRMMIMWVFLSGAILAIVNDYVRRG